ncbi:hypothetical protein DFH07DRAFT_1016540 [Mycena maculata]|uniref:Uncharacterized protein n=1 Tax=Mycena maculata TaxID=230809 RepID=A0AAD7H8R0_9AGAR|nr:hypothetical protein DFH07DRAFT_1016540 [Mycena maculata]
MTTRTQTSSSPFSRLSLIGKGSQSPSNRMHGRPTRDDDYIPYNGPYEEPPKRPERSRDSWGDPLYDEDGNNMVQEAHQRYVPAGQSQYPWHGEDEERKSRPRARTHSGVSGRTISSGTVDPHRASVSVLRKGSNHANVVRPPVPSYINLDATGGVGESPAQPSRAIRETPPKRTSLASIFTFGQASKKVPLSPAKVALPTSPPPTSPLSNAKYTRVFAAQPPQRPNTGPASIYSISSDHHNSSASYTSQEVDPFHSYYNYTPSADQFGQLTRPQNASPPPHPYASPYASNFPLPEPPQTAPLVVSPKLKFTAPPATHRIALPQEEPSTMVSPQVRALKSYASTPNLHDSSRSPNRLRKPLPAVPGAPKGKDRWLSAETWCDAIMFPRPRLKVEDAQLLMRGASGRVVSPPGSPVFGGFNAAPNPDRPEGVVSRVLAHSRSMASLNAEAGPSRVRNETFRGPSAAPPPPPILLSTQTERPPRPKSFALDDLALPSPVPSLARVLEEGQILEHQRKKWQMQATGSFQNTRARSLSRSRAKSLTHRGSTAGQSSMDFLAARSFLGNQDTIPVLPARVTRSGSQNGTNTNGTTTFNSRSSHSHSNSLAKTTSKSSHTRNESWSRTAIKKAAAMCYVDGVLSPADEKTNGLENALRGEGTRVIRLADPALMPVDSAIPPLSALSPRAGVSPTPSATSDAHMGIAVSTPPPNDSSSFERESIHLPSHPYAQTGVSYAYHNAPPAITKGADYAGPHPAVTVDAAKPDPQDFSARHRLPPQASLTYHPYASPSSRRDSYQIVPRTDSDVPGPSKMWAQLSPGVVREILPGELLYSPFMSERSATPEEEREADPYLRNRKSTVTILDTVGLGETLAYAVEEEHSRDSGLGTSEEAPDAAEWADDGQATAVEAHHPYRIHRKPVQYDISRPLSTPKKSGVSSNNHTVESSPVDPTVSHEHRLTPPTPPPLPTNRSGSGSSPALNSAASSPPRSPPPVGSVDDLDDFRDLFYRPNLTDEVLNNLNRPSSSRQPSVTWDLASTTRTQRTRTGSGLTSLARQLSQEFEELRAIRHGARSDSMGSDSSISRFSRFPTENDIQFIFTESDMSRAIPDPVGPTPPHETMSAFHPSSHLPEDVESSRTSSPINAPPGDEEDEPFRVGNVESVATPPATASDYRTSYTGLMAFHSEHPPPVPKDGVDIAIPRIVSELQPDSADPTRSSYMTESTVSRISTSDFPAPPPQHMTPAHMSLLNSYFQESVAERVIGEEESVATFSPPRVGERF